jgi:hypothetical protein
MFVIAVLASYWMLWRGRLCFRRMKGARQPPIQAVTLSLRERRPSLLRVTGTCLQDQHAIPESCFYGIGVLDHERFLAAILPRAHSTAASTEVSAAISEAILLRSAAEASAPTINTGRCSGPQGSELRLINSVQGRRRSRNSSKQDGRLSPVALICAFGESLSAGLQPSESIPRPEGVVC